MKNIIFLILLAWVSNSIAKPTVAKESISDADSFKVERPVQEQSAQRSVAGDKIKKKKKFGDEPLKESAASEDSDSEVRYWKYSEE